MTSSMDLSRLIQFAPWAAVIGLFLIDVPGAIGKRLVPRMNLDNARFIVQVIFLFTIPLASSAVVDGPRAAFSPDVINPAIGLSFYLAIDWARCRIASSGEKGKRARALETRYALGILVVFGMFVAATLVWILTVPP